MTVIKVPQPPKSAFNKNRPVSALLKNQMEHMQTAEFRLPARQQTNIYINKIRTEGEAAEYIRQVTAILHPEGARPAGLELAAMAERKSARKKKGKVKPKTKKKSPRNKKK
ncbi:MAG TPA: hypothetical protein VH079_01440 [Terriglobales bacterium]|jgi:hypothetical protein|nr:hypothetical protein [Terriglobales bacterium]